MIAFWILDIFIVTCITLLGACVLMIVRRSIGWMEFSFLAFPLGAGIFTWVLFLASIIGLPISTTLVLTLYIILLIILGYFAIRRVKEQSLANIFRKNPKNFVQPFWAMIGWMLMGTFIVISSLYSVGRSYSSWDAAAFWALKGYGIVQDGSVYAANDWGIFGVAYPLNIPLQISIFKVISNDMLPGSKLIFPMYYVSLIVGSYYFWRQSRLNTSFSLLAALFLITNPFIFLHSTIGYTNLPFTCYVVLGTLFSIRARARVSRQDMLISGLLWSIACWTRPEGIIYAVAILLSIMITEWILKKRVSNISLWVVPILILNLVWYLFSWESVIQSPIGDAVSDTYGNAFSGSFNLGAIRLIVSLFIKRGLHPDDWGLFLPVSITFIIISLIKINPFKVGRIRWLLLPSVVAGILPIALFYVQFFSYEREKFIEILIRSFDRAFLPAALLIMFLAFLMFGTTFEMTENSEKMMDNNM